MNGNLEVYLTEGLKAMVCHFCPTQVGSDSWRVIVKFFDTTGKKNLVVPFGKNNEFTEYFIWITAEYLEDNTRFRGNEQGAREFALNSVVERYEETRDEAGDRSISKIEENSVVCFHNRCKRGKSISLPTIKTS